MERTLLLIAGPSGSGKSRLTRLAAGCGAVALCLDDFYRDADAPGLPRTHLGIPDWDHVDTWDLHLALSTLGTLLSEGAAELPTYDISLSRRTGTQRLVLGSSSLVLAEGIFAIETLAAARAAGIKAEGIWLDRPKPNNFARRLTRDLKEHRKTPTVLLRRGVALYRAEASLRSHAMAAGFNPVSMRSAVRQISA